MAGGGSRRDEGSLKIGTTNVFAALETLKKKKKSDKESSKSKGSSRSQAKEPEPQVFWAPTPITAKSWADVDDDDDDDYYATTAPPQPVWGSSDPQETEHIASVVEESESEDDVLGIDEGDEEVEEPENEPEVAIPVEPVAKKPLPSPGPAKDTERQLSKKELKKKELAELEAVLAELGISGKDSNATQDDSNVERKAEEQNGDGEKKENASGASESKSSKKKKAKKEKSSNESKEAQEQPDVVETNGELEDTSAVDVKERIKKMASLKKKKSTKEMDSAARVAANEAAARSARLAAAKKKEKNHYNQQPLR
ncbi:uncharacterized protein [Typha angustifolia]|uniref:uncharacterized protein n=1 Tax=Typha angustifolia TaxID=59011 RepID=UPI003C301B0D